MMVSIAVELCRGDALAWMVPEQIDDVAVVGKLPSGNCPPAKRSRMSGQGGMRISRA